MAYVPALGLSVSAEAKSYGQAQAEHEAASAAGIPDDVFQGCKAVVTDGASSDAVKQCGAVSGEYAAEAACAALLPGAGALAAGPLCGPLGKFIGGEVAGAIIGAFDAIFGPKELPRSEFPPAPPRSAQEQELSTWVYYHEQIVKDEAARLTGHLALLYNALHPQKPWKIYCQNRPIYGNAEQTLLVGFQCTWIYAPEAEALLRRFGWKTADDLGLRMYYQGSTIQAGDPAIQAGSPIFLLKSAQHILQGSEALLAKAYGQAMRYLVIERAAHSAKAAAAVARSVVAADKLQVHKEDVSRSTTNLNAGLAVLGLSALVYAVVKSRRR